MQLNYPQLFREQCYIDGQWLNSFNQKTHPVFNPFDEEKIGTVPDCGVPETKQAITAAHRAFKSWRGLTASARAEKLFAFAQLITQHSADLAKILTIEQGKPLKESLGEINYANSFIKWFAEEARRAYGDIIPAPQLQQHLLVLKQPVGVVGAITPWNFPSAMITRKCAPALAAGCTIVIKPALETPYSALALAQLAEEAGFPPGVFNVITGSAVAIGGELTSNPLVRKISFTGSTAVGKKLMQQSASTIKKISLELGGNAPFIVFDDADLDAAVAGLMTCKFRNSGQTCVSANRIYVQDAIYDTFAKKLVTAVKTLQLGNGLTEGTTQGPLINPAGLEKVKNHVADAVAKGAEILCGGHTAQAGPLFFEPTVLGNAQTNMTFAKAETFGPVAPLFRFKTDDEVIAMANDTEFGLASYFYGRDIARVWHCAEQLEYGMVGINVGMLSTEVAPFGGIKESGIGREGSKYGMDDYLELKYLCMGAYAKSNS